MPEQKTALIIEDDESLLEAIEHEFTSRGFRTLRARSVPEALTSLETADRVDVIWLDHYLLGKSDGIDFVARIKNGDKWNTIPIFVVSNSSGSEHVRSYLGLGVNQYYTKADYDLSQIVVDIENELSHTSHA